MAPSMPKDTMGYMRTRITFNFQHAYWVIDNNVWVGTLSLLTRVRRSWISEPFSSCTGLLSSSYVMHREVLRFSNIPSIHVRALLVFLAEAVQACHFCLELTLLFHVFHGNNFKVNQTSIHVHCCFLSIAGSSIIDTGHWGIRVQKQ